MKKNYQSLNTLQRSFFFFKLHVRAIKWYQSFYISVQCDLINQHQFNSANCPVNFLTKSLMIFRDNFILFLLRSMLAIRCVYFRMTNSDERRNSTKSITQKIMLCFPQVSQCTELDVRGALYVV